MLNNLRASAQSTNPTPNVLVYDCECEIQNGFSVNHSRNEYNAVTKLIVMDIQMFFIYADFKNWFATCFGSMS